MKTIKFIEKDKILLEGKTVLRPAKYMLEYSSWYVIKDKVYH
jgi:hypothetical protein